MKKIKKKSFILIYGFLCILCLAGCGKKAEPMNLPAADAITSIEIPGGVEDSILMDKEQIASVMDIIGEAKATAKESTQDVPLADTYTQLDLVQGETITSLFIYEEDSRWYIEQPYQGIYETDESLLELLKQ